MEQAGIKNKLNINQIVKLINKIVGQMEWRKYEEQLKTELQIKFEPLISEGPTVDHHWETFKPGLKEIDEKLICIQEKRKARKLRHARRNESKNPRICGYILLSLDTNDNLEREILPHFFIGLNYYTFFLSIF